MIVPLAFLILGCGFIYTLATSIMRLLNVNWKDKDAAKSIKKIVTPPLIMAILLIVFVMFILPYLEANGIK